MYRLKLFIICTLLAAPAWAADRVIDYVDPYAVAAGQYPENGQVLALEAMAPFQKVEGGYLIRVSEIYVQTVEMAAATAFLETKADYQKGLILAHKNCTVVGMYDYVGLDGFHRSVYHLKENVQ